ncbi:Ppx/GppA family phosphatase [Moraxella sp. FZFQ2102]|uniref:Ppx/GppA phosphatase family protein n=1 Tax=Moraxella sp. FZFQ2102 TaxID=2953752 RepID=UPI00209C00B8|nr:Ppx/GppA phosphatase family protein [Moraxella sp. FZFQ2102]USZ15584.1 Ppx/GppA family phosphatase [Moraxella sp. FZFQ2102]
MLENTEKLASVDIGSNSIHLAIAERHGDKLKKIASMSEKVQLGAGLDEYDQLSDDVQLRGLDCLARFAERLTDINADHVRVVATNALRRAINGDQFIQKANAILPSPIEVISGREEARLIYLGVSHTCPSSRQRLVVDIGGGSTELIIGKQALPILTESAQMGSVSFTQRFFKSGQITALDFEKAIYAAQKEIIHHANRYKKTGFDEVIGSSGTIKTIKQALAGFGMGDEITLAGVEALKDALIRWQHIDEIDLDGVKAYRKAIFPAGVAILLAVMKVFGIRRMRYCDGALREGVMYDMLARFGNDDVRDDSVQALMTRFNVDKKQAKRVAKTAQSLFEQVESTLKLPLGAEQMLRRAAFLHEIGLAIGHGSYHQHSAYMLKHADMAGFSRTDQEQLSHLVRHHRRTITSVDYGVITKAGGVALAHLALILRLAVVANHTRTELGKQQLRLIITDSDHWHIQVQIDKPEHQACVIDIGDETPWFAKWGIDLSVAGV